MFQALNPRRFRPAEGGNVLMLAAFLIPALLALAGLAIDFQFTVRQKAKTQQVLDSAILAGAVQRQAGASEDEVIAEVKTYVAALSENQGGDLSCDTVIVTFDAQSEDIAGEIRCDQPTFMSTLIGYEKMEYTVGSTSTYGIGKIDVAFIFDVSGSMNSQNRLPLLKSAASEAFDVLLPDDQVRDGSVRLGVVTYNHGVNAGAYFDSVTRQQSFAPDTSNTQAKSRYDNHNDARLIDSVSGERYFYYEQGICLSWSCNEWSNFDWDASRREFSHDLAGNSCVAERVGDEAYTDAAPGNNDKVIAGNPHWNFNASDRFKWYGQREVEWWGADAYSYGAYTGRFATCRPSGPVPLTENKAALKAHVDGLTANGGTAGHIGLAWGWYLVSPNWSGVWPAVSNPWPYDEADSSKAIILMTDGDFNTNHPDADHDSFTQAMNLCDEMKAEPAEIQVYTVGFQVPDGVRTTGSGQTILEYCATSPDHAFDANSGEELTAAYRAIARSISDLRLKN